MAFDHLGLKWEYEPQGYELPSGRCYLPDFWLPDQQVHVEVKGDEAAFLADGDKYAEAVHTGSLPGRELIILGPIPDPERLHFPYALARCTDGSGNDVLCVHAIDFLGFFWSEKPLSECLDCVYSFCTDICSYTGELPPLASSKRKNNTWTSGCLFPEDDLPVPDKIREAYIAARSARFEHGEHGV